LLRWAMLVSRDLVRLSDLEEGIRMAGYSPRRVPDLQRAWSLLGLPPGGSGSVTDDARPGVVLVDLVSLEEEGLEVIRTLSRHAPAVALLPEHLAGAEGQTRRWGALALLPPHDASRVAACLAAVPGPGPLRPGRPTGRLRGATRGAADGPPSPR
jgi:hypothetical protein